MSRVIEATFEEVIFLSQIIQPLIITEENYKNLQAKEILVCRRRRFHFKESNQESISSSTEALQKCSIREILHAIVLNLIQNGTKNVLTHGYLKCQAEGNGSDAEKRLLKCRSPHGTLESFCDKYWRGVVDLLRVPFLVTVLTHPALCVFEQLPKGCWVQLSGIPINEEVSRLQKLYSVGEETIMEATEESPNDTLATILLPTLPEACEEVLNPFIQKNDTLDFSFRLASTVPNSILPLGSSSILSEQIASNGTRVDVSLKQDAHSLTSHRNQLQPLPDIPKRPLRMLPFPRSSILNSMYASKSRNQSVLYQLCKLWKGAVPKSALGSLALFEDRSKPEAVSALSVMEKADNNSKDDTHPISYWEVMHFLYSVFVDRHWIRSWMDKVPNKSSSTDSGKSRFYMGHNKPSISPHANFVSTTTGNFMDPIGSSRSFREDTIRYPFPPMRHVAQATWKRFREKLSQHLSDQLSDQSEGQDEATGIRDWPSPIANGSTQKALSDNNIVQGCKVCIDYWMDKNHRECTENLLPAKMYNREGVQIYCPPKKSRMGTKTEDKEGSDIGVTSQSIPSANTVMVEEPKGSVFEANTLPCPPHLCAESKKYPILGPIMESMLFQFQLFLENLASIPFERYYNTYCANSSGASTQKNPNVCGKDGVDSQKARVSTPADFAVPSVAVRACIRAYLEAVVPSYLWGGRYNRELFFSTLEDILQSPRSKIISASTLLDPIKTGNFALFGRGIDWSQSNAFRHEKPVRTHAVLASLSHRISLHGEVAIKNYLRSTPEANVPTPKIQELLYGQASQNAHIRNSDSHIWYLWLLVDFVLPLVRQHFYVTDGDSVPGLLFFRKAEWRKAYYAARRAWLENQGASEIPYKIFRHMSRSSIPVCGFGGLRLRPKKSGFRVITQLAQAHKQWPVWRLGTYQEHYQERYQERHQEKPDIGKRGRCDLAEEGVGAKRNRTIRVYKKDGRPEEHRNAYHSHSVPPQLNREAADGDLSTVPLGKSYNAIFHPVHEVLRFLRKDGRFRTGSSLFGMEECLVGLRRFAFLRKALQVHRQKYRERQAASDRSMDGTNAGGVSAGYVHTMNASRAQFSSLQSVPSSRLSMMSTDFRNAFDTMHLPIVKHICATLFQESEYYMQAYCKVSLPYHALPPSMRSSSIRLSTSSTTCLANLLPRIRTRYKRIVSCSRTLVPMRQSFYTVAEASPGTVFCGVPGPAQFQCFPREDLRESLKEQERGTWVFLKDCHTMYRLGKGIPQGSVLSTFLCNMYYSLLENRVFLPRALTMRFPSSSMDGNETTQGPEAHPMKRRMLCDRIAEIDQLADENIDETVRQNGSYKGNVHKASQEKGFVPIDILSRPVSLILRLCDDICVLSESAALVQNLHTSLSLGIPSIQCEISKSKTNLVLSAAGDDGEMRQDATASAINKVSVSFSFTEGVKQQGTYSSDDEASQFIWPFPNAIPWCGLLISDSGEVSAAYTRYMGTGYIWNSPRSCTPSTPTHELVHTLEGFFRPYCLPVLLDGGINSVETVAMNLFELVVVGTTKFIAMFRDQQCRISVASDFQELMHCLKRSTWSKAKRSTKKASDIRPNAGSPSNKRESSCDSSLSSVRLHRRLLKLRLQTRLGRKLMKSNSTNGKISRFLLPSKTRGSGRGPYSRIKWPISASSLLTAFVHGCDYLVNLIYSRCPADPLDPVVEGEKLLKELLEGCNASASNASAPTNGVPLSTRKPGTVTTEVMGLQRSEGGDLLLLGVSEVCLLPSASVDISFTRMSTASQNTNNDVYMENLEGLLRGDAHSSSCQSIDVFERAHCVPSNHLAQAFLPLTREEVYWIVYSAFIRTFSTFQAPFQHADDLFTMFARSLLPSHRTLQRIPNNLGAIHNRKGKEVIQHNTSLLRYDLHTATNVRKCIETIIRSQGDYVISKLL